MASTTIYAAVVFLGLLVVGLAIQTFTMKGERNEALNIALNNPEVQDALKSKVDPIVGRGAPVPVVVYLDPASPPQTRVYVIDWLNPDTLFLTSLVKVKVRVEGENYSVVEVRA